ncbi:hypothetical protein OAA67_04300, partial [Winogradskyella sp.]|nr:hypothetical protein [Winogradskyella sp.]
MAGESYRGRSDIGHDQDSKFASGDPFSLKIGVLTRVDEINLKGDIKILTGGGEQVEIDLSQGMCGPRSFFGGVPEVNSIVIVGYRKKSKQVGQAMILAYIPTGSRLGLKFDPVSPIDPTDIDEEDKPDVDDFFGKTTRFKRLKLRPGDVGGMSASGAELVLTTDVKFYNRAGAGIELRDVDRTLIMQAVHKLDSVSGVFTTTGPIRRGAMFLPTDISSSTGVLTAEEKGYYGQKNLVIAGPGKQAGDYKYANSDGKLLGFFSANTDEFPPVTYSNGRRVFYPATNVASNFEDPDTALGALAYTERRTQISHTTDCTQEVREEIDGFQMDRPRLYIEETLGTLVGNASHSSEGLRHYGRLLKPVIFEDVFQQGQGKFRLEEVPRSPHEPDLERDTTTGAYLFRIKPPNRQDVDTEYGFAVSKQGKVFVNIPGSTVERYPSGSKNVSVEANLEGALKFFCGAETGRNASIVATLLGGIIANIGHLSNGKAMELNFGSSVDTTYSGTNDTDNMACRATVNGNESKVVTGDSIQNTLGAISHTANGGYSIKADALNIAASNGLAANYGGISVLSSGKSQYQYAQLVLENIVTGGKISTILAGAQVDNVVAGARTYNTLAGATLWNSPAGAYTITVGAGAYAVTVGGGAISMTAGAAVSLVSGAIVSIAAGGIVSIASPAAISLLSVQILLGGPPAVFGVCRGLPMMPP